VFIEDGNPDTVNDLINISKRVLTYRTIFQVLRGQTTPFPLKKIPSLFTYLFVLAEVKNEEALSRMSSKRVQEESTL
jgi:hypothetical protein